MKFFSNENQTFYILQIALKNYSIIDAKKAHR